MLTIVLAVACYLPNSTFAYNPVTRYGTMYATYGPPDITSQKICESLDGKLVRCKIFLTNNEQLTGTTFQFRYNTNLDIQLTALTAGAHTEAQRTTESTFELEFLELQENIEQTLSSYQIQSYDFDSCFTGVKIDWSPGTLLIYGTLEKCNYAITDFGANQMAEAYLILGGFVPLYIDMSASIAAAMAAVDGAFSHTVDCALLDQSNAATCEDISAEITTNVLYELSVQIIFWLSDYSNMVQINAQVEGVYDTRVRGCFSGTYAITDGLAIIEISRDPANPACDFAFHEAYIQGGYLASLAYTTDTFWYFNLTIDNPVGNVFRFFVECSELDDREACENNMSYVERLPESWFKFRTFFVQQDDSMNFLGLTLVRKQWCYSNIEATLMNGQEDASIIELQFTSLNSSECEFTRPVRTLLELAIYERNGNSFGDHDADHVYLLNQREVFSIENTSIQFQLSDDQAHNIRELSASNAISIYFFVENAEVPIAHIYDKLSEKFGAVLAGITVGAGALLGIIGFLMNFPLRKTDNLKSKVPETE